MTIRSASGFGVGWRRKQAYRQSEMPRVAAQFLCCSIGLVSVRHDVSAALLFAIVFPATHFHS